MWLLNCSRAEAIVDKSFAEQFKSNQFHTQEKKKTTTQTVALIIRKSPDYERNSSGLHKLVPFILINTKFLFTKYWFSKFVFGQKTEKERKKPKSSSSSHFYFSLFYKLCVCLASCLYACHFRSFLIATVAFVVVVPSLMCFL